MTSGWNVIKAVKKQKVGEGRVLVQFDHVVDKNRVFSRGRWAKNLVILHPFLAKEAPNQFLLDCVNSPCMLRVYQSYLCIQRWLRS